MPVAVAKLTWDDIKDWPETRVELVDGEAVFQPVPSINHQRICQNLGNAVLPYVESNRLGEFSFHPIRIILDPVLSMNPTGASSQLVVTPIPMATTFEARPI